MNNALKYVKLLEGSGISREQAETHVQIMSEFMEDTLVTKHLATKQDVHNLTMQIQALDAKIDTSVERLEHKMLQAEYRSVIKLGTIVTVVMGLAVTILKVF